MTTGCPDHARLVSLTLGTLPESELDALARHLDVCPRCEERLHALDRLGDPLLDELRAPQESTQDLPAPLLAQLRVAGTEPPRELVGRRLRPLAPGGKLASGSPRPGVAAAGPR